MMVGSIIPFEMVPFSGDMLFFFDFWGGVGGKRGQIGDKKTIIAGDLEKSLGSFSRGEVSGNRATVS